MTLTTRRLFTWIDVDAQLERVLRATGWPDWLAEVSAYWGELELAIDYAVDQVALQIWLNEALGPGTAVLRDGELLVLLESIGIEPRMLRVVTTVGVTPGSRRLPFWREPRVVRDVSAPLPDPSAPLPLPMLAFHSYKGGVGRTTHALAAALSVANNGPVLLVDGDLEAPGLSWMYRESGREAQFSFEDFIALLHSSDQDDAADVVDLAAKFVTNQQVGNIFFLPSKRDLESLAPARITPADLLVTGRPNEYLSNAVASLAKRLGGVGAVIDLRAGATELSSQLLLDPRIERVFVTTASSQSILGIEAVIDEVGRRAPSRSSDNPVVRVVLTQYHPSTPEDELAKLLAPVSAAVTRSISIGESEDETSEALLSAPVFSVFRDDLLQMPASWEGVASLVENAGLKALMTTALASSSIIQSDPPSVALNDSTSQLSAGREKLSAFAGTLAFAEMTDTQQFLATQSLSSLTSSHRTELPISVVTGAKGAGKTFTQLQMLYRRTWESYGAATGISDIRIAGEIVPVLWSRNLGDDASERVRGIRSEVSSDVPAGDLEVIDALQDALAQEKLTEREWRKVWLWTFARAVGLQSTVDSVEDVLLQAAAAGKRYVFVLDGLEDILQNVGSDVAQQRALRVLLLDSLDWLRSIHGRPYGAVVFVRRDLVRSSFRQNSEQFLSRYKAFELAWDETEALRLAAWVSEMAGVIESGGRDLRQLSEVELAELMLPVWGEKMGTARSREARSRGWFIAALSDFNGGIQARDIVTFMHEAARESVGDERWSDRLLTPAAMRSALIKCSNQKIAAIGEETPRIAELFARLRSLDDADRQVPITRSASGLDLEEVQLLEDNGIMFREEDRYWIPEIFRQGLGFRAVGRPRILAVANLVRKRNNVE